MQTLLNLTALGVSFYLILKGSDWITDASVKVSKRLSTSNLAVGLILISFLLSMPELVISVSSILKGHSGIGFGIAIGSVIVNIGLIAGISAIVRPLRISRIMVTRDMIFMVIVTIVVVAMALEGYSLNRTDGFILLILFIPYVINVYEQERGLSAKEKIEKTGKMVETLEMFGEYRHRPHKVHGGVLSFILGAVLLIISSEIFVRVLIELAVNSGISDIIIGITLGAIGPSLPNLAAAVHASRKGVEELAISETIGSNIFTLLITLGMMAVITPIAIDPLTIIITAPALLTITFVLLFFMLKGHVTRRDGLILITLYALTVGAELISRVSFTLR